VQVLLAACAQYATRWLSLRASANMHNNMLMSILYAPLSFFHTTPSGRIINRLAKDTSDIDRNLATYASSWFQGILQLLSTAAVIGVVTPFVLPGLVPVLLAFGMLYLYFQASVREVKRLDALSRSPIFTAVGNTLTVRSSSPAIPLIVRFSSWNEPLFVAAVVTHTLIVGLRLPP
jgi:ABC-type multidrug transport system fused ATPase/permease subunit